MKTKQTTITDKKYGKRVEFLEKTSGTIPENGLIEPYYHLQQKTGRHPHPVEALLRMYLLQIRKVQ
jgi:hypothetical protein